MKGEGRVGAIKGRDQIAEVYLDKERIQYIMQGGTITFQRTNPN